MIPRRPTLIAAMRIVRPVVVRDDVLLATTAWAVVAAVVADRVALYSLVSLR